MKYISNVTRSPGDPKGIVIGPSSLGASGRLARALGWFSFGLGLVELVAPKRLTRALGMEGRENLFRLYGARELGAGVLTLSLEKEIGLWGRVGGDALDVLTLAFALRPDNPKRGNAKIAIAMVLGVTLLDLASALAVPARHPRGRAPVRNYSDRSGFPQGVDKARGAARGKQAKLAPA